MGPDDTVPLIHPRTRGYTRRQRVSLPWLTRKDLSSLTGEIIPRPKRVLPKGLTHSQLNICRTWIMNTFSFNTQLQLRNRTIFEVMWDGALRKGSLLGLRLKNIDWSECTILVSFDEKDYRDAWYRKSGNQRTAKTGEYIVILADQTLQWLDHYRQAARPIEAIRLNHGLFFCEHGIKDIGHPLGLETLRYFFDSMSKPKNQGGTGIHVTPHMLRHTWATMALNDELPMETIQQQLGHADISTTELYSRIAPEKRRQILKKWRESYPERYAGMIR